MDLPALKAYLDSLGPHATLAATDSHLPPPLQTLLASMPARQTTLDVGADGVSLSGSTLTVSGTTTQDWPVAGMAGVSIAVTGVVLVVVDGTPQPTATGTVTGVLPVAGARARVICTSTTQPVTSAPPVTALAAGWVAALDGTLTAVTPEALVLLGSGQTEFPFPVPASLDVLAAEVVVQPGSFALTFFPDTTYGTRYQFALTDPAASWTLIPDLLAITGIDLGVLVLRSPGPAGDSSLSVQLTGHLAVDGMPVDLIVGLSSGPLWTVTVRPGSGHTAFPGLASLVRWLLGGAASQDAVTGFGDVGFGVSGFDAAIESMSIAYDWQARALNQFQIVSLLTLGALRLDVAVTFPAVTLVGGLHGGPVGVPAVLEGFGLPSAGVPATLQISDAFFHADPTEGRYLASLTVADTWPAGAVALESLTVSVGRDPALGIEAEISALLLIGTTVEIALVAGYGGADLGWEFAGGTAAGSKLDIGDLITELSRAWGIPSVPAPIAGLELTAIHLAYASVPGHFAFTCEAETKVTGAPVGVTVSIDVKKSTGGGGNADGTIVGTKGYSATFAGKVTIAELEFDLVFDVESTGNDIFVATFSGSGGATTVALATLVADLSPSAGALVPADLSIDLVDVKLALVKPDGKPGVFAVGLDLTATPLDLSRLPVVGDKLPPGEALTIQALQVVYSSGLLERDLVDTVNKLFPPKVVALPSAGLAPGPALTADVRIGTDVDHVVVGVPTAPAVARSPQPGSAAVPAFSAGVAPEGPAASAPAAYWIDVQRQLGVLQINRIGLIYQANSLLVGFDGGISLGPVELSLQGLAVGSSLSSFSPKFGLDGLGLSYVSDALTISGALLRVPGGELAPDVDFQFDGFAVLQAEGLGLAAVASYAQLSDGRPSLFVYAQLETPLGGPPAFFVTGLMAGFGVNRSLSLPPVDQVAGFPLVALGAPPAPGTAAPPQTPTHVLDVLEGRAAIPPSTTPVRWITPAPGQYWLAVGLEFTSFEVVRTRALLVAEFGHEFELALLGTSTLQLPEPGESSETYAYVELQLEAVFAPAQGFFGVSAELAPASYLLTEACHLTGGFAFYLWFDPAPADRIGQFVVTLGGYHPAFTPLPWFPKVPKLGFNWKVSDEVTITGSAYFALTTSCVMAGAALDVEYSSGNLGAWFRANADMLVSWRPFFFTVQIGVSVGVSYRLSIFGIQKTISLSLSATVDLWGPPTGGRVTVHLWILSFTVAFGSAGAGTSADPLLWKEFAGLLPPPSSTVTVLPGSGITSMHDASDLARSTSGKVWYARAAGLTFSTQSSLPASTLSYGAVADPHPADVAEGTLAIRPMNLTGVSAVHEITVRRGSPTAPPLDVSSWSLTPRRQNLPESLWGAPPKPFSQIPGRPSADLVAGALVGYDLVVPAAVLGPTPGAIAIAEYAEDPLPPGTHPLDPRTPASPDYLPAADATSVRAIVGIAGAREARDALVTALVTAGVYGGANGSLDVMAAMAGHAFSAAPMLEPTP